MSPPSDSISAAAEGLRTTLTVCRPRDIAIVITARPTGELAAFWITSRGLERHDVGEAGTRSAG
jgi:hypothetical protein